MRLGKMAALGMGRVELAQLNRHLSTHRSPDSAMEVLWRTGPHTTQSVKLCAAFTRWSVIPDTPSFAGTCMADLITGLTNATGVLTALVEM